MTSQMNSPFISEEVPPSEAPKGMSDEEEIRRYQALMGDGEMILDHEEMGEDLVELGFLEDTE